MDVLAAVCPNVPTKQPRGGGSQDRPLRGRPPVEDERGKSRSQLCPARVVGIGDGSRDVLVKFGPVRVLQSSIIPTRSCRWRRNEGRRCRGRLVSCCRGYRGDVSGNRVIEVSLASEARSAGPRPRNAFSSDSDAPALILPESFLSSPIGALPVSPSKPTPLCVFVFSILGRTWAHRPPILSIPSHYVGGSSVGAACSPSSGVARTETGGPSRPSR